MRKIILGILLFGYSAPLLAQPVQELDLPQGYIQSVKALPNRAQTTFSVTTLQHVSAKYYVEGEEYGIRPHNGRFPIVGNAQVVNNRPTRFTLHQLDVSDILPNGAGKSYYLEPYQDRGKRLVDQAKWITYDQLQYGVWEGAWVPLNGETVLEYPNLTGLPNRVTLRQVEYRPLLHLNRDKSRLVPKTLALPLPELDGKWMKSEVMDYSRGALYRDRLMVLLGEKKKGRENKGSVYRDMRLLTYDLEGNLINDAPLYLEYPTRTSRFDIGPDILTGQEMGPVWYLSKLTMIGAKGNPNPLARSLVAADLGGNIRWKHDLESGNQNRPLFTYLSMMDKFWLDGKLWILSVGSPAGKRGIMSWIADEQGVSIQGIERDEVLNRTSAPPEVMLADASNGSSFQWMGRELLPDGSLLVFGFSTLKAKVPEEEGEVEITQYHDYLVLHFSTDGELLHQYGIPRYISGTLGQPLLKEVAGRMMENAPWGYQYLGMKDGRWMFCVWEFAPGKENSFAVQTLSETGVGDGAFAWATPPLDAKPVFFFVDPVSHVSGWEYNPIEGNREFFTSYDPAYWDYQVDPTTGKGTLMMVGMKIKSENKIGFPYFYFWEEYQR